MGKSKNCSPGMRKAIVNLSKEGYSYATIAAQLDCSKTMVFNALKHYKTYQTTENVARKKRPRKTTPKTDRRIVRLAKKNPLLTAVAIHKQLFRENPAELSVRSIRRRLVEAQLGGRVARKKPMVSAKNRRCRIEFANSHKHWTVQEWKNVLWSDETKINRIGSDGRQYVRRPPRQEYNPKYTTLTVKHGGGCIQVWGCMSWHGVGPIHKVEGRMDQVQYRTILETVMLPFAEDNLPVIWKFQHDNDPKHTAATVRAWLEQNSVTVLKWPSCSPDLNPIEYLWADVKAIVKKQQISNLRALYEAVEMAWNSISKERCQRLIESMPNRCAEVLKNKGYPTRY